MKLSLRPAAVLAILFGLLLPAGIGGYLSHSRESLRIEKQLQADHQRKADILALGMQDPLWNLSPEAGRPLIESMMGDSRVVRITVMDASLGTFLSLSRPERQQGQIQSISRPVTKQGHPIGTVTLEMDDGPDRTYIETLYQQFLAGLTLQTIVSLLLVLALLNARVLRPMKKLLEQARKLSHNQLDTPFSWSRDDELGKLGQHLEISRQTIKKYQDTLKQKNLQLETELISHRQTEAALRTGQDRYRHLVENTHLIPWEAIPNEWRFTYVGPQSVALLGYPTSVWYSDSFLPSYLHPDDRHLVYRLFSESHASHVQFECRLLAEGGREVWVLVSASAQTGNQSQVKLHGYMLDITEHKHNQLELDQYRAELEEKLEEKNRNLASANQELESFAHTVSHDLRIPLRTIEGYAQIMQDDYALRLDSGAHHYLQRIRSAAGSMLEQIEDILNLYKLLRTEIRPQPVNLSRLVYDVAEELNALELDRQVEIEIAPDIHAHADPKLIRIVLYNLLGNAWKYTRHALPPTVRFGSSMINGQPVYFVGDNGIGFDMKDADRLFTPFQRLHSEEEFLAEGNGIGLAIVQRIISRHDGHVWAKSSLNEGATFYFTLAPEKISS